ncbi:MAG: LacI family DNA-binding transcriptional regulator [Alphaproteobacteria bacterium]
MSQKTNRPRATLKDIAAATGFSANTVSLALRDSPRLPECTRARILEEARRLNYTPNHIARSLASNATRTIGLVLTDIMNPTLTLAARTIERELAEAGYAMMFATSDTQLASEMQALELFLSYQVDGMLIYPAHVGDHAHIKAVEEAGTPVLLLADLPGLGLDAVAIDDRAGARKVFSHFCARGHRRFAMLDGGRRLGNLDKLEGALRALREAGLGDESIRVFEPESHAAAAAALVMDEIMALDPRPTALFASTDSLAIGALHWCRQHGVRVPDDLAIAGYDNTEISAYGVLPLTTVNYAADEISRIAVDRILRRIENGASGDAPETRLIEPELIVRASA